MFCQWLHQSIWLCLTSVLVEIRILSGVPSSLKHRRRCRYPLHGFSGLPTPRALLRCASAVGRRSHRAGNTDRYRFYPVVVIVEPERWAALILPDVTIARTVHDTARYYRTIIMRIKIELLWRPRLVVVISKNKRLSGPGHRDELLLRRRFYGRTSFRAGPGKSDRAPPRDGWINRSEIFPRSVFRCCCRDTSTHRFRNGHVTCGIQKKKKKRKWRVGTCNVRVRERAWRHLSATSRPEQSKLESDESQYRTSFVVF